MRAKWLISGLSVLGLTMGPALVSAQEGNYLNYGGVQVPIRSDTPSVPDTRAPGSGSPDSFAPGQRRANTGSTAQSSGADGSGETTSEDAQATADALAGFQTDRISGVTTSQSADRYSWFYGASELYYGVIPNLRDSLPHIERHQTRGAQNGRPNSVTWIGFQPLSSYTRVFIQTARSPQYSINRMGENGEILEVVLDNTRISLRNFMRYIDASEFGRSVQVIDAERMDKGRSRVLILLDGERDYTASVDGNYLYIDFQDVERGRW